MVVNEIEGSRSFEEIIAGVEGGRESVTDNSKVAPSVPVQETRETNVVFNGQASSTESEGMRVDQAEYNEVEDHSGTGSALFESPFSTPAMISSKLWLPSISFTTIGDSASDLERSKG